MTKVQHPQHDFKVIDFTIPSKVLKHKNIIFMCTVDSSVLLLRVWCTFLDMCWKRVLPSFELLITINKTFLTRKQYACFFMFFLQEGFDNSILCLPGREQARERPAENVQRMPFGWRRTFQATEQWFESNLLQNDTAMFFTSGEAVTASPRVGGVVLVFGGQVWWPVQQKLLSFEQWAKSQEREIFPFLFLFYFPLGRNIFVYIIFVSFPFLHRRSLNKV